jgi:nucleoside-diphosphate-sugar epimerase
MQVCVFGGAGFIGKPIVRRLLNGGHKVVTLVRNPQKRTELEQLGAEVRIGDLRNRDDVREALRGAKVVINVAVPPYEGRMGLKRVRGIAKEFVECVKNILDEAERAGNIPAIISEGTPMWGDSGDGWHDEKSAFRPLGTGRIGELSTPYLDKMIENGAPIIRISPAPTYGAGSWFDFAVYDLIKKGWFRTFGDGRNVQSFVHVEDLAEVYRLAAEKLPLGESFAIADDQPVKFVDFANCVARAMGKPPVKSLPIWIGHLMVGQVWVEELTMNHKVRNTKVKEKLGWRPAYPSYEQGIPAAIAEIERR